MVCEVTCFSVCLSEVERDIGKKVQRLNGRVEAEAATGSIVHIESLVRKAFTSFYNDA